MSAERPVAVVGASGKTGRAVTAALAARGVPVVPVGRAQWPRLPQVLAGVRAVSLIAPNLHADEPTLVGEVLAAAGAAGVERIVYHSVTAPYAPDLPHHLGKAVSEDLVRRSGLAWTILQPCAYVQNLVPALRDPLPALVVPYDVHARFGLVDLVDVAAVTALALHDDEHVGATYELGGLQQVSVTEVGAEAQRLLGRPVPVSAVDPATWVSSATGLSERERRWLLAMVEYYDRYGLPAGSLAIRALLGKLAHPLAATLARELGVG
ncbi:MAG: NmrA family NAD(P)-binding protein [Nocardioides sp.]